MTIITTEGTEEEMIRLFSGQDVGESWFDLRLCVFATLRESKLPKVVSRQAAKAQSCAKSLFVDSSRSRL